MMAHSQNRILLRLKSPKSILAYLYTKFMIIYLNPCLQTGCDRTCEQGVPPKAQRRRMTPPRARAKGLAHAYLSLLHHVVGASSLLAASSAKYLE